MNDDVQHLQFILTMPNFLHRKFSMYLQEIWRQRELEYIQQHGRTAGCACLMYQVGDYKAAREYAYSQS